MKQGKVFLVGAGPGDAGLLTLKGKEALEGADVVVYDALVSSEVFQRIPENACKVYVGKRAGNHAMPQEQINKVLLDQAQAGKTVVRLKGGDPFLFGRGGEELELLAKHGVPFEVVPGVSAALAAPAYAGIPVTHRACSSSVHILTGHGRDGKPSDIDYHALAALKGTLVFMMGVGAAADIQQGLLDAGMPAQTPAAVIANATTAQQNVVTATLETLSAAAVQAGTPAVLVVGNVCAFARRFAWTHQRPLNGTRILVTRPAAQSERLAHMLRTQGAQVVTLPAISLRLIWPNTPLKQAFSNMKDYQWMVLTSPSGVEMLFEAMERMQVDVRALVGVKFAAIGIATARALRLRGVIPALVPQEYSAAALGKLLAEQMQLQERALLVRAREGAPDLTVQLDAAGRDYDEVALYDTLYPQEDKSETAALLDIKNVDFITFTSASTVRGLAQILGSEALYGLRAVCIGQTTAKQAREYGMTVFTAQQATLESMVELVINLKEGKLNGAG